MSQTSAIEDGYSTVVILLSAEFAGRHVPATIVRCVTAARDAAAAVTGSAPPDLVERIARRHLHILTMVHDER